MMFFKPRKAGKAKIGTFSLLYFGDARRKDLSPRQKRGFTAKLLLFFY
jgi:hypothetical protein